MRSVEGRRASLSQGVLGVLPAQSLGKQVSVCVGGGWRLGGEGGSEFCSLTGSFQGEPLPRGSAEGQKETPPLPYPRWINRDTCLAAQLSKEINIETGKHNMESDGGSKTRRELPGS